MFRQLVILFFLFFISAIKAVSTHAANQQVIYDVIEPGKGSIDSLSVSEWGNLSRRQFEQRFGHKMNILERMAFRKTKREIRRSSDWESNDEKIPVEAKLAATMASLGLGSFALAVLTGPSQIDCEDDCSPFPTVMFVIAVLLLAGSFVTGIIGLNKLKKAGTKKGKGKALYGILAALLIALLILVLLLML